MPWLDVGWGQRDGFKIASKSPSARQGSLSSLGRADSVFVVGILSSRKQEARCFLHETKARLGGLGYNGGYIQGG